MKTIGLVLFLAFLSASLLVGMRLAFQPQLPGKYAQEIGTPPAEVVVNTTEATPQDDKQPAEPADTVVTTDVSPTESLQPFTTASLAISGITPTPDQSPVPTAELTIANPTPTITSQCTGDINKDGKTDSIDMSLFISNFGSQQCGIPEDIIADCHVNIHDYALMIASFGCN